MEPARHLIVLRTFALGVAPSGALVVDNLSTGERLGEAFATVTPLKVGEDQVVLAGPAETPEHDLMVIELPGERGGTPYPVEAGAWMTPPLPYTSGMVITAVAQDSEGNELFRLQGPPIRPNDDGVLRPMLGPSWTLYGPQVD